jgi:Holliday junction DNA helicase RuvB
MSLGHILFAGPPGTGKTSLARVVARELSVNIFELIGPRVEHIDELDEVFSKVKSGDIVFIDEIHSLKSSIEETLYSAMEDYIWKGNKLSTFTLIGATTKEGNLNRPFRDRFTIIEYLSTYSLDELSIIIAQSAGKLNFQIQAEAIHEIARRSRGTPRLANQYLLRTRDYAVENFITLTNVLACFKNIGIDENGLDRQDRKVMVTIQKIFKNRPVGITSLSNVLGEDPETIQLLREPYLVNIGMLVRGPSGRYLTEQGIKYANKMA